MPNRRGMLAALGAGSLAFVAAPARAQPRSDGTPRMSPEIVSQLAPTGVLRAAINMGNFLLVTGRTPDGGPDGVSPEMAREIAKRLGVPVKLIPYARPNEIADAAGTNAWDIANIGAEPQRAAKISFTTAYCEIEATYLVPAGSPITSMDQVDRKGIRICSGAGAAYTLWLERNIKHAELVLVPGGGAAAFQKFLDEKMELCRAAAGPDHRHREAAGCAHPRRPVHGGAAGDRHRAGERGGGGLAARLRRGGEGLRPRRAVHREAQGARPVGGAGGLSRLIQPERGRWVSKHGCRMAIMRHPVPQRG